MTDHLRMYSLSGMLAWPSLKRELHSPLFFVLACSFCSWSSGSSSSEAGVKRASSGCSIRWRTRRASCAPNLMACLANGEGAAKK